MFIRFVTKGRMTKDRLEPLLKKSVKVFEKYHINIKNVVFELGPNEYYPGDESKRDFVWCTDPKLSVSGLETYQTISALTLIAELEEVLGLKIEY